MPEIKFLLWSNKHSAWWRPDSRGYTENRDEAGRYTEAEALERVLASSMCMILSQVTCMVAEAPGA
jgi:hypothetical protein